MFIRPCNFDQTRGFITHYHSLYQNHSSFILFLILISQSIFLFPSSAHRLSTQQHLYMWEVMWQSVQGSARLRTIALRGWVQVSWRLPQEQQDWILWKNSRMSMCQGRENIRCEFFCSFFFHSYSASLLSLPMRHKFIRNESNFILSNSAIFIGLYAVMRLVFSLLSCDRFQKLLHCTRV